MARASDPQIARTVAKSIVARLRQAGHVAYFAGGCVRDELLGLHPTDYDIATDAPPARIRELFARTSEVGAAFGVMLVYDDPTGVVVEVATFRSDGTYSDARRPDTVHFSDAAADAARRDFTINALFLDPLAPPTPSSVPPRAGAPNASDQPRTVDGAVIDFVQGVADLHAGLLRAVGNPDQRLAEDHLRALRAVRFAARLGLTIDPGTAEAIKRHASELRGVSRERIGEELKRMLAHPTRAAAVALLQQLTLDAPTLTEPSLNSATTLLARLGSAANPSSLSIPPAFSTCLGAWALDRAAASDPTQPLAPVERLSAPDSHAWSHETARRYRRALCLSNDECAELSDVLVGVYILLARWPDMRISQRKRAAARAAFMPALSLIFAGNHPRSERIYLEYKELQSDSIGIAPPALVTGDTLIHAGFKPGPRFKGMLDQVYDAQLEGSVRTPEEAMELARRLSV